jgi:hypothetical protein
MSERKRPEAGVRREDLIRAVQAARTAWVLTSLEQKRSRTIHLKKRSAPAVAEWTFVPQRTAHAGRCSGVQNSFRSSN